MERPASEADAARRTVLMSFPLARRHPCEPRPTEGADVSLDEDIGRRRWAEKGDGEVSYPEEQEAKRCSVLDSLKT